MCGRLYTCGVPNPDSLTIREAHAVLLADKLRTAELMHFHADAFLIQYQAATGGKGKVKKAEAFVPRQYRYKPKIEDDLSVTMDQWGAVLATLKKR